MTQTADLKTYQFESHSGKETIEIGRRIAELLTPPNLLILRGDLGAGKTTLVKGIAEALNAADPDEVTSPMSGSSTLSALRNWSHPTASCWWSGARSFPAWSSAATVKSRCGPRAATRAALR